MVFNPLAASVRIGERYRRWSYADRRGARGWHRFLRGDYCKEDVSRISVDGRPSSEVRGQKSEVRSHSIVTRAPARVVRLGTSPALPTREELHPRPRVRSGFVWLSIKDQLP